MNYTGIKCPVCDVPFLENDDIVVPRNISKGIDETLKSLSNKKTINKNVYEHNKHNKYNIGLSQNNFKEEKFKNELNLMKKKNCLFDSNYLEKTKTTTMGFEPTRASTRD